ncbi:MAG: hypothetical protein ACRECX_03930 [Methyloceanibacter sp.]|uniref:hypothetical protein n=1 Tax=Methyloceanibacter sp. TaxID=1965321 RepID=UPI003D6D3127
MITVNTAGFELVNAFSLFDDATLNLNVARSSATAVVGGVPHLFVASNVDAGVSAFRVEDDGSLTNVDNVVGDATLTLDSTQDLATATVDGVTFLFVAGGLESVVSVFRVDNDGTLTNVDNVNDDATLNLRFPFSVATAEAGGATYLFAAALLDNGVSVFRVESDGSLTNVDNVNDDATLNLAGAVEVTTAEVGGTTYLFAAGLSDNGVSVFRVEDDGTLTNVDNVSDDATLQLQSITSTATVTAGGVTHLFVRGGDPNITDSIREGGVSVFRVDNDGSLTNVFNLGDDFAVSLSQIDTLTTATVNGVPLLFLANEVESVVSMFRVGADGALDLLEVLSESTAGLIRASAITTATAGGVPYLFAPGGIEDGGTFQQGVSVFRIEAPLAVTGTAAAETLVGGGSDDLIAGLGGNDILDGGAGNDTLLGGDGFDTVTYANAAGAVTVNLAAGTASKPNGTDTLESIERVIGGDGDDLLFGHNGRNSLIGGDGNDALRGRSGNDVLRGQGDNDFLAGGNHRDRLFGDDGDDRLLGQNGNDTLRGGNGDDLLFGQNGRDRLIGGDGDDLLTGGRGRDIQFGNDGDDIFVFTHKNDSKKGGQRDRLLDFDRSDDLIDLSAIDAKSGGGNQKFKFIGKQDFHDKRGELRYEDKGSKVIAQGDVNGDGKADFEIFVNVGALGKGDFLL